MSNKNIDKSVLFVNVPTPIYRELRRMAYEKETTITGIVILIIDQYLQANKEIQK